MSDDYLLPNQQHAATRYRGGRHFERLLLTTGRGAEEPQDVDAGHPFPVTPHPPGDQRRAPVEVGVGVTVLVPAPPAGSRLRVVSLRFTANGAGRVRLLGAGPETGWLTVDYGGEYGLAGFDLPPGAPLSLEVEAGEPLQPGWPVLSQVGGLLLYVEVKG